mmetsp:Transcript_43564/g.98864  ORF Transcript_43564/g.98864 Transcript_43564/m.98864 type:complete len:225 (-) Transcript_43564:165-839(-)
MASISFVEYLCSCVHLKPTALQKNPCSDPVSRGASSTEHGLHRLQNVHCTAAAQSSNGGMGFSSSSSSAAAAPPCLAWSSLAGGGGRASATAPGLATGACTISLERGKSLIRNRFRKDFSIVHVVPSGRMPGPMVDTQNTDRRIPDLFAPPQCMVRESYITRSPFLSTMSLWGTLKASSASTTESLPPVCVPQSVAWCSTVFVAGHTWVGPMSGSTSWSATRSV